MEYGKMIGNFLSGAWQKADSIAEDIAGSEAFKKYYKRIIPGSVDFASETAESFAKRASAKTAAASASNMVGGLSDEVRTALAKARSTADIEKIATTHNLDKDVANAVKEAFSDNVDQLRQSVNYAQRFAKEKPLTRAAESTIAYFTNPDKATRNTRIAAVAGTYGVAAIGARYMNGGTLTRDQYGRSDIAGIPFI